MTDRAGKTGIIGAALGLCLLVTLLAATHLWAVPAESGEHRWQGVDEAVVEKIARERGREARPPLLRTDRGDLTLFVFLLAGAFGGFVAGYYWRKLLERGVQ